MARFRQRDNRAWSREHAAFRERMDGALQKLLACEARKTAG
jgi:hypothetical protein